MNIVSHIKDTGSVNIKNLQRNKNEYGFILLPTDVFVNIKMKEVSFLLNKCVYNIVIATGKAYNKVSFNP